MKSSQKVVRHIFDSEIFGEMKNNPLLLLYTKRGPFGPLAL